MYLRNGAEIEHALVVQAGQVGDNIRDVPQGIGDQKVEAGEGRLQLLGMGQVLETTRKLTPSLREHGGHNILTHGRLFFNSVFSNMSKTGRNESCWFCFLLSVSYLRQLSMLHKTCVQTLHILLIKCE